MTAREGDVISLIGASGSGKSTLLRCINMLEQPNDGAMSLDGQAIRMIKDPHGMRVLIRYARRQADLVQITPGAIFVRQRMKTLAPGRRLAA